MKTTDFDYIRNYVRSRAAIVIEPGKEYLVESRLAVLARREKIATIDALVETLRSDARHPLHRKVLDVMTTNETSFFRDIHPFEALKKHIIPELKERHASSRMLNFWCGAASTGQECYSVLMTLAEHHPDIFNTWKLNFIATDLSQDVLEQAVAGRYTQLEVNRGLPAPMLIKYFKRNGDFWFVDEKLRAKVMFRELNLIADWPLASGLDVVFLRNVLIYFDIEVKKQILGKIRKLLRPGGVLFLGSAETTLGIDDSFERVVHDRATCYRNPG
jgi:chemotaxis protein methyltransferase CheR